MNILTDPTLIIGTIINILTIFIYSSVFIIDPQLRTRSAIAIILAIVMIAIAERFIYYQIDNRNDLNIFFIIVSVGILTNPYWLKFNNAKTASVYTPNEKI